MTNLLSLPPELLLHIERQFLSWKLQRYPEDTYPGACRHMLRLSQAHPTLKARRQDFAWQCLYHDMWWSGHPPTMEQIYPPEGWRDPPLWQREPWRPMSTLTLRDADLPPQQRQNSAPLYSTSSEQYGTSPEEDDATSH